MPGRLLPAPPGGLPRFYAPPDPSMAAVDFPELVAALEEDLGSLGAAEAARGLRRVSVQLEAVLASELVAAHRRLRRELAPFDPRRGAPGGSGAAVAPGGEVAERARLDEQEAELLDSLVTLLLKARYVPLTAGQWKVARSSVFTFDIPVRIDWGAIDPSAIRRYLGLPTDGTPAGGVAAAAAAAAEAEAGAGALSTVDFAAALAAEGPGAAGGRGPWQALPAFSDRVLVFVRGVGISTARGQYYNEKLDLLVSYVLLDPLQEAASRAWRAFGAPLAARLLRRSPELRSAWSWLQRGGGYSDDWAWLDGDDDEDGGEVAGRGRRAAAAAADDAAGFELLPPQLRRLEAAAAASERARRLPAGEGEDVQGGGQERGGRAGAGRAARFVERRTLRTLLPTVPSVALALPREELLTEPTFKQVVIIYRRASPSKTLEDERRTVELSSQEEETLIEALVQEAEAEEAAEEAAAVAREAERRAARRATEGVAGAAAAAPSAAAAALSSNGAGGGSRSSSPLQEEGVVTTAAASVVGGAVGGALGRAIAGTLGETLGVKVGGAIGGVLGSVELGQAPAAGGASAAAAAGPAAPPPPGQEAGNGAARPGKAAALVQAVSKAVSSAAQGDAPAAAATAAAAAAVAAAASGEALSGHGGPGASDQKLPNLNPRNICLHAFNDIPLADLELVFPEKTPLVQPLTLLQIGFAGASAAAAGVTWLVSSPPSSWSLLLAWSAVSVVAAKAAALWGSVTAHQNDLQRIMASMQYERECASGTGVLALLAEELGVQQLKEAATCYGVLLLLSATAAAAAAAEDGGGASGSGRGGTPAPASRDGAIGGAAAAPALGGMTREALAALISPFLEGVESLVGELGGSVSLGAPAAAAPLGAVGLTLEEINEACEEFVSRRFGANVDFQVGDVMPRMLSWGLVRYDARRGTYSPVPPAAALSALDRVWEQIKEGEPGGAAVAAGATGGSPAAAGAAAGHDGSAAFGLAASRARRRRARGPRARWWGCGATMGPRARPRAGARRRAEASRARAACGSGPARSAGGGGG